MTLGYVKVTSESPLLNGEVQVISPSKIKVLASGISLAQGPIGPEGPQGPQGPQGNTGAKGDTGNTGAQGPTGAQGSQGIQGIKGDKGNTGNTGSQGIQGIQGTKGDTGDQGIQGIQGIQGEQGVQGDKGDTGNTGNNGADGDRYHTTSTTSFTLGTSGSQTITTVDLNLDYSIGQTVIVAYDIDHHQHGTVSSYNPATGQLTFVKDNKTGTGTFASWTVNLDGAVGIQGPQGIQGEQGVKGDQGDQGIQGIQGDQGIQGIEGAKGDKGDQGDQGIQGEKGDQGDQGTQGIQGDVGPQGDQGIQGETGNTGAAGADASVVVNSTNIKFNGVGALDAITSGADNMALGFNSLDSLTSGQFNVGLGNDTLNKVTTGISNMAIGKGALEYSTGNLNVAIGTNVMGGLRTGANNTAIGGTAGQYGGVTNEQTYIGAGAGGLNGSGLVSFGTLVGGSGYDDGTYYDVTFQVQGLPDLAFNSPFAELVVSGGAVTSVTITEPGSGSKVGDVLIIDPYTEETGLLAGSGFSITVTAVTTTQRNTGVGRAALQLNPNGANNVAIGYRAGWASQGSNNVFIGYTAGQNEQGSNKLYIDNTTTATPLIYGEFDNNRVKINGDFQLTTKTPSSASDTGVTGTIAWDANYIYICTATDTWKRASIGGW